MTYVYVYISIYMMAYTSACMESLPRHNAFQRLRGISLRAPDNSLVASKLIH